MVDHRSASVAARLSRCALVVVGGLVAQELEGVAAFDQGHGPRR